MNKAKIFLFVALGILALALTASIVVNQLSNYCIITARYAYAQCE